MDAPPNSDPEAANPLLPTIRKYRPERPVIWDMVGCPALGSPLIFRWAAARCALRLVGDVVLIKI